MTTEEFDLSEKRYGHGFGWKYDEEDVKEFIRRLKEFMKGNSDIEPVIIGKYGIKRYPIREIDKLAGARLAK